MVEGGRNWIDLNSNIYQYFCTVKDVNNPVLRGLGVWEGREVQSMMGEIILFVRRPIKQDLRAAQLFPHIGH